MLKQLLVTLFIIVAIFSLLFYVLQRSMLYFPDINKPVLLEQAVTGMKEVVLKTKDKLALISWYKAAESGHKTVLILHGNAGNIGGRLFMARQFAQEGLGVFLLEYRGYGANPGFPSEKGFYEDAAAAMAFLKQEGVGSDEIILYGESLGTGVATELAVKSPVSCLILQSPFSSMTALARYHYPWILLLRPWDKYDSLSRMKSIKAPILVIHGKLDVVVPYAQGLALFEAANGPKKMLSLDGKNHNDLWEEGHFFEDLMGFIRMECH